MLSCTKNIMDHYHKLSYSERLFADFVLSNKNLVIHMPIGDLANTLGVAASTVIASTKKLGYSGFREFKIALAAEQTDPTGHWNNIKEDATANINWYQKVIDTNVTVLQDSLNFLQYAHIEQTADELLNATAIHIYGIGTSAILAREAFDFFFRLCLNCMLHEDTHHQRISVSMQKETDISLIISQSGMNRDILFLAERIKRRDRRIIGISNFSGTPFSKYCDILLAALPTVSTIHDNHFSLRVPIICILETLFYAISQKMGDRYSSALDINHEVIKDTAINAQIVK